MDKQRRSETIELYGGGFDLLKAAPTFIQGRSLHKLSKSKKTYKRIQANKQVDACVLVYTFAGLLSTRRLT